ncbi:serine/threonine protein kinase [Cohnella abietis]|uniref:non-specific serine/threonine protein kinase n=1 Tax=Cohnella abietis TaxID=2507935 RepID=A0A3T1D6I3_9BACL|nr:serine/threonine-protein kinase [Cohnella abietis]BBI33671.1 hypothetical protein KCTCHS21_30700 [Cohnella abietis]
MEVDRQAGLELTLNQLYGERYKIIAQIGRGGMGRVYLAEDIRLGGKVRALKLTRPLPEERRSFLPEAQLLSELDHPHLPAIVDYYPPNENGVACIVMDYIAGDTLAERLERYGYRLPFSLVFRVLIDLCEVLIYLHSHTPSIVFRDLKPSNVLLDKHNKAILVDFGIARRYREESQSDTLQLGTPGFAAPEQIRGEQSDNRTDLYGLGALAYHLLSGGQFAIRHRGKLKQALQGDVPSEFNVLLERLLAIDPADRPQTAGELRQALKRIELDSDGRLSSYESGEHSDDMILITNDREREKGVTVIAVASAYPGAGATFASVALSSSLARLGIVHALVECPGGEPELFALLNGSRNMPKGAVYAEANGLQAAFPAWRKGKAVYYPAKPEGYRTTLPDGAFSNWLRRLGAPIVLLDVSSSWEQADLREWVVRSVDHIAMVADCYPVKWSSRRQLACMELQKLAKERFVKCVWIANRDQAFLERKQWLSLFPLKPEVYLPDLASAEMINTLWRGEGMPTDAQTSRSVDLAFQKWITSFYDRG